MPNIMQVELSTCLPTVGSPTLGNEARGGGTLLKSDNQGGGRGIKPILAKMSSGKGYAEFQLFKDLTLGLHLS